MANAITQKSGKNLRWYMRYLHNKIGFFITGLVIIYSLSGIVQTYRDTGLLKHVVAHQQQLPPHLGEQQIGGMLRQRNFKITSTVGDIQYFKDGSYNAATGQANYTTNEWYVWVKIVTELHKTSSKSIVHYFTVTFSILLLFMCISAFWMFKPGTKMFSSGVLFTIAGIIAALLLLIVN